MQHCSWTLSDRISRARALLWDRLFLGCGRAAQKTHGPIEGANSGARERIGKPHQGCSLAPADIAMPSQSPPFGPCSIAWLNLLFLRARYLWHRNLLFVSHVARICLEPKNDAFTLRPQVALCPRQSGRVRKPQKIFTNATLYQLSYTPLYR